MYARAEYDDVVGEVAAELSARDAAAREAGIAADRIILDPGLGFAKRAAHSFAAARRVAAHSPRSAGPSSCGPSRKSFLTAAIGDRAAR